MDSLDEIMSRKTKNHYDPKQIEAVEVRNKNDILHFTIYDTDNDLIRMLKQFLNDRNASYSEMNNSGFFKATEVYNIRYVLSKSKEEGSTLSWNRAMKVLDYFGYTARVKFTPIEGKVRKIPRMTQHLITFDINEEKDDKSSLVYNMRKFIQARKDTVKNMTESGFFNKGEPVNIVQGLRYKNQCSYARALRICEYYGYDMEIRFIKKRVVKKKPEEDIWL